ncbi:GGDEF domain-containing protein [Gynuella sunshinyii]|uniref:diguanylate cyclase n=1 Tax=Gynuella sunshinyii YC6258 TaxID=1445510 RepID=A0A0C5V397_9GAMM|nr:GGDEF domain-containing protein [Gynuella sunshinyii]AJQ94010.1 GGDEF domain [Gynuella sunshinyii YC6258]
MTKYLVFTVLYLAMYAHAGSVVLTDDVVNIRNFEIGYLINSPHTYTIDEAIQAEFTPAPNRLSLPSNQLDIWVRFSVRNASDSVIACNIHNSISYFNRVMDFYETRNGVILDQKHIDLFAWTGDTKLLHGTDSVLPIHLNPGEEKTYYFHFVSPAYQYFEYLILDDQHTLAELSTKNIFPVLLVGMLIALACFNFLLFFSARYKEYLYYSLYLVSSIIWFVFEYGILSHYFGIYGMRGHLTSYGLLSATIFLSLFVKKVLQTAKFYPLQNLALNSTIVLLVLNLLWGVVNFFNALDISVYFFIYAIAVYFWVSISLMRQGNTLVKYLLAAQLFFIFFALFGILFYEGYLPYNWWTRYSIAIGVTVEAFILAYLLSHRIKLLKVDLETDSLTGAFNRRTLFDQFMQESKRISALESLVFVIFDIDQFKLYNDTYGHPKGDDILKIIIHHLQSQFPESSVFRLGGEEFALLFTAENAAAAQRKVSDIRLAIEHLSLAFPESRHGVVTASFGASVIESGRIQNFNELYQQTDARLYQAKHNGRNCVVM